MTEKTCTKCGETKPLEEFHRRSRSKDGRGTFCKVCSCRASRIRNKRLKAAGIQKQTNEQKLASIERRKERYLEEHGVMPPCSCGCGERVEFDYNGKPRKYVEGHKYRDPAWKELMSERVSEGRGRHVVSNEKVADALKAFKEKYGLTYRQLAEHCNYPANQMRLLLWSKKHANIGVDAEQDLFKALESKPDKPPVRVTAKEMSDVLQEFRSKWDLTREELADVLDYRWLTLKGMIHPNRSDHGKLLRASTVERVRRGLAEYEAQRKAEMKERSVKIASSFSQSFDLERNLSKI